jgi:hypothetical protein
MRSLLAPLTFDSLILFFLFSSVSFILIFLVTRILQCSDCERPATTYLNTKHYLASAVFSHCILLYKLHFFEYFRINSNKIFECVLNLQNIVHNFIKLTSIMFSCLPQFLFFQVSTLWSRNLSIYL